MSSLPLAAFQRPDTRDHGSAAILTYIESSGKQNHVLRVHRRSQDFCLGGGGAPGNFFVLTMFWQHSQYDSRLGFKF